MDRASLELRLETLHSRGVLTASEFASERKKMFHYFEGIGNDSISSTYAESDPDHSRKGKRSLLAGAVIVALAGGTYFVSTKAFGPAMQAGPQTVSADAPSNESPATKPTLSENLAENVVDPTLPLAAEAPEAEKSALPAVSQSGEAQEYSEEQLPAETETRAEASLAEEQVVARRAVALGYLGNLISPDDYPAAALSAGVQGTTVFRLTIGRNGRATECSLVASSGSDDLDSATCSIMLRRARFRAATNAQGTPTTDSLTSRIQWRLAQ